MCFERAFFHECLRNFMLHDFRVMKGIGAIVAKIRKFSRRSQMDLVYLPLACGRGYRKLAAAAGESDSRSFACMIFELSTGDYLSDLLAAHQAVQPALRCFAPWHGYFSIPRTVKIGRFLDTIWPPPYPSWSKFENSFLFFLIGTVERPPRVRMPSSRC